MRLIYSKRYHAAMPRNEKIQFLKSGLFEIPSPTFWEKLRNLKETYQQSKKK